MVVDRAVGKVTCPIVLVESGDAELAGPAEAALDELDMGTRLENP